MNHFPLPKGKGHIRIPNLTSEDYTHGDDGFQGYPARSGWSLEEVEGKNSFGGRSTAEVEAFFQSWLYFGCAIEVLAVSGIIIQPSDLLDADQKFVSTRQLPFFIRQWRQRVMQIKDKNHPIHIEWAMKTALILKKVSGFVDTYCLPYYAPRGTAKIPKSTSPLPQKIWMSIIALGHTLTEAMISYYKIVRTGNHWGASTMLRSRMLRKGWCPMDVNRSLTDMGIDGHYYMAKSPNPEVNISHSLCTRNECLARNIDEISYKQRHIQEEGECCHVEIVDTAEGSELVEIIESDKTPVYYWDSVKKELKIRPSQMVKRGVSDPGYIAISHVWSDGMGNPSENALPQCQLQRIQEMVDSAEVLAKPKGSPRYFWLDTLCVPVGDCQRLKDLRLRCIRNMARIYKGAAAVLVLSSTIRKVATTDSETERGLALYLANWNRRLWTFQEGMFAEKLLLQFSDKLVDFDEVEFPGVTTSVARGHCVTFPSCAFSGTMAEFLTFRELLRDRSFEQTGPHGVRVEPLILAINGIQFRSTSKPSDETICLGTLMRLRIERLQGAEKAIREEYCQRGFHVTKVGDHEIAERRMEIFMSIIKVFPHDIIFNTHRRLVREGFRWAPASLLGIPRRGFARNVEGSFAIFDKDRCRLSFTGPGIVIQVPTDGNAFSKPNGYLMVEIPRDGHESLELRIDHSGTFSWAPDTYYGIILRESITKSRRRSSKSESLDWIPRNGPELEKWYESLYPVIDSTGPIMDAVIGTIRHRHGEDGEEANPIQIRHECLGTVTLLNPSAIIESDLLSDLESVTESEESEDPGKLSDSISPDDSDDPNGFDGSDGWEDSDDDDDDADDDEGFDLSEDFEVGSERSEESEDSQNESISTDERSADVFNDTADDCVTDPDVEWDRDQEADSEDDESDLLARDLDSSVIEEIQEYKIKVSGGLKSEDTKWFIL